jgi:hypothetical protein
MSYKCGDSTNIRTAFRYHKPVMEIPFCYKTHSFMNVHFNPFCVGWRMAWPPAGLHVSYSTQLADKCYSYFVRYLPRDTLKRKMGVIHIFPGLLVTFPDLYPMGEDSNIFCLRIIPF